jgi:hypothetical protein
MPEAVTGRLQETRRLGIGPCLLDEILFPAVLAAGIFEVVRRPLISPELASALARCLTVSEISVS